MRPDDNPFHIDVRVSGGRGVVAPVGELDLATVPRLAERLDALAADGCAELVVDLRGLTFVDSTGVRLLAQSHRDAAASGRTFAIVEGGAAVMRVLELTGVSDFLARSEPDAAGPS